MALILQAIGIYVIIACTVRFEFLCCLNNLGQQRSTWVCPAYVPADGIANWRLSRP